MLTRTKQWVPPLCLTTLLFILSLFPLSVSRFHPAMSSSHLLFILASVVHHCHYRHFVFSSFSAWPHLWRTTIIKQGHCVLTLILRSATRSRLTVVFVLCSETCQVLMPTPPPSRLSPKPHHPNPLPEPQHIPPVQFEKRGLMSDYIYGSWTNMSVESFG